MNLKSNADVVMFLKAVKKCRGDVFLETDEGDRLNLKSVLSQYIFAVIADDRKFSVESRIICSEGDAKYLDEYLEA